MTDSSSTPCDIIVHVCGHTDVGRSREHNEDAFIVVDLTAMNATLQPEVCVQRLGGRGSLFMVADGMGGAASGEVASKMATEVVLEELDTWWRRSDSTDADTFAAALRKAVEAANARIHRYALDHPENRGMGTTTTVAGLLRDQLYLCQVGDSRAYLVRDGVAVQVTKDQSLVQRLIDAGEITAAEAEVSERRNIILQALGPEPQVSVDLTVQQIRRGDTLILCSDGMSGQMRTDDIARIVTEHSPELANACKALIELANANGGPDNITVIAARFEGSGLQPPTPGEFVGHRRYRPPGQAHATTPMDAALSGDPMEDEDLLGMSLITTTESENPIAPGPDTVGRWLSTPSAPAATTPARKLSVTQLRRFEIPMAHEFLGVREQDFLPREDVARRLALIS